MKKKVFESLLVCTLSAFTLAGCGKQMETTEQTDVTVESTSVVEVGNESETDESDVNQDEEDKNGTVSDNEVLSDEKDDSDDWLKPAGVTYTYVVDGEEYVYEEETDEFEGQNYIMYPHVIAGGGFTEDELADVDFDVLDEKIRNHPEDLTDIEVADFWSMYPDLPQSPRKMTAEELDEYLTEYYTNEAQNY